MVRQLRRHDRRMDPREAEELLRQADYGFLATCSPEGQPYVIPVNHVYHDGYIVFHCAQVGHKLDNIRHNNRVCYAVCTEHRVIPEKHTTAYASALAFGEAEIVEDPGLKKELLQVLCARLAPGTPLACSDEVMDRTCVVRIKVMHVSGKMNRGPA